MVEWETEMSPIFCLICKVQLETNHKLSLHVKKSHNLKIEKYLTDHVLGYVPTCPVCNKPTRRSGFSFKKYCREHGPSSGGAIGGKSPAWNKGKTKETDERIAEAAKNLSGSGNHFFGKKHSDKTRTKISFTKTLKTNEIFERFEQNSRGLFVPDVDSYTKRQLYMNITCSRCSTVIKKKLEAVERGTVCPLCDKQSIAQTEIGNFISSLGFIPSFNDRSVITPSEIDVFIASHSVGVEHHGLYWHTSEEDARSIDKMKHRMKAEDAISKNIKLIQLFSDEWIMRRNACESIIKNSLHHNELKLNARSLLIREISWQEAKVALDVWHLAGSTRSKFQFGLFNKDQLVQVISFRIPYEKKYKNESFIELARLASAPGITIRGGQSKLISECSRVSKLLGFKNMLSYSDLRLGGGKSYISSGFSDEGITAPDYWYTDGKIRMSRFKVQATSEESEKELATRLKLRKIFGTGSRRFIKSL